MLGHVYVSLPTGEAERKMMNEICSRRYGFWRGVLSPLEDVYPVNRERNIISELILASILRSFTFGRR